MTTRRGLRFSDRSQNNSSPAGAVDDYLDDQGSIQLVATFAGFWHGPPIGAIRSACLRSFLAQGHRFKLYTYRSFEGIPEGIEIADANAVIPESEVIWFGDDLGPFSDLFRYTLLREHGGWWCDVDTVCLSASIPDVEEAWSQEWPEINPEGVGNGQICLKRGSELASELHERCLLKSQSHIQDRSSLGPHLFTATIKDLGLEKNKNGNYKLFYPVNWLETFKLWLPEYRAQIEDRIAASYFLPIYQSFPTWCGIDLLKLPPEGSYLHGLLKTYDCLDPNLSTHDANDVREAIRTFLQANGAAMYKNLAAVCGPQIFSELGLQRPKSSLRTRIGSRLRRYNQAMLKRFNSSKRQSMQFLS